MKVVASLSGMERSLKSLRRFAEEEERALQDALEYILRQMCNYVKQYGPWRDQTANLRNSISINIDTMREWPADTPSATLQSLIGENETPIIKVEGDGYTGCISAGMEYAIWVELKDGYWVLQGAIDHFEPLMEKYFQDMMAVDKLDLIQAADIQYSQFLSGKGMSESEIGEVIQAKHDFYNGG